jgi:hypothetical protein
VRTLYTALCHTLVQVKSQVWVILLQSQVRHIEFSPSVVTTKSRQNDNGVGKELAERSIKEYRCLSAVDSHGLFMILHT